MLLSKVFLRAGLVAGMACAVALPAVAGTISATFNFDTTTPLNSPLFTDTNNGVTLIGIGAGGVCDSSAVGAPFTSISGNAMISGFCVVDTSDPQNPVPDSGGTVLFFDHNLTSLEFDWATDDSGLLSVIVASQADPDLLAAYQIGSTDPCPTAPEGGDPVPCLFEGHLSISGVGSFNALVLDSDNSGSPNFAVDNLSLVATTPEPSSLALLGTGALGVVGAVRRRMRQ